MVLDGALPSPNILGPEKSNSEASSVYEEHSEEIASVFRTMGHDITSASLDKIYKIARPWTMGDHWALQEKIQVDESKNKELMKHFERMGMVGSIMPTGDTYNHLIVLGGTALGNDRRTQFAKGLLDKEAIKLADGGDMWFWAGQRPRLDRETPALINTKARYLEQYQEDRWLQRQSGLLESAGEWGRPLATETELARLSLMGAFGPMQMRYARLQVGLQKLIEGVPVRAVPYRSFEILDPGTKIGVTILDAAAVRRPQGVPRHTTSSSATEWIKYAQPNSGARVLVINNNPHIQRGNADIQIAFNAVGRSDLQLESAGPAALETTPAQVYLGEIARMIYNAKSA